MSNEADFYIKKGDTSPELRAQLKEDDGTAVDLTSADVYFQMQKIGDNSLTVDSLATIDTASEGKVSYSWSSADTDGAGYYNAVFGVDYNADGTIDETFPNEQYLVVKIDEAMV